MVRSRSTAVKRLTEQDVVAEEVDVLFLTWIAARAVEQLIDDAVRAAGVTGDEFAVLSVLAARPGGLSPTELARWMAAPPTTVSSYLKRFEGRGHVVRERDPLDRRSYRIRLTATGEAVHQAASERFGPLLSDISRSLGAKEPEVRSSLLRLREAADDLRFPE